MAHTVSGVIFYSSMELLIVQYQQILMGVLVAINLFSFCVMGYDKRKAMKRNDTKRTPEGVMFFLATMFGSIGIYTGMFIFRHKIRKWYFQLGIPLLMLQNAATFYLIRELFM